MTYDSALAQLTINTSNVVPQNFVAEQCVNLVYDNIDFGEEIAKQMHVTNGIITQKMAAQNDDALPHSCSVINKSQRTVKVPASAITEYNIGVKKTPTFHKIPQDAQPMSITLRDCVGRTAYKLDLAYVLTKMVCASDEKTLPVWTWF